MNPIDRIEAEQLRTDIPDFRPGDTVRVHVKIVEGDKERLQAFEGIVIRKRGAYYIIKGIWPSRLSEHALRALHASGARRAGGA